MWLFNKKYYADDWDIVDLNLVRHSEMGLGCTGWGVKLLLRNKKTGRPKKISIGNFFGMSSIYTIRDKLFSRHGILLNVNNDTVDLYYRGNQDEDTSRV